MVKDVREAAVSSKQNNSIIKKKKKNVRLYLGAGGGWESFLFLSAQSSTFSPQDL